jgi:hypothetical protein
MIKQAGLVSILRSAVLPTINGTGLGEKARDGQDHICQ